MLLMHCFSCVSLIGKQQSFTFIPIHAKPSDAVAELNNLIAVYDEAVKRYGPVSKKRYK